MLDLAVPSNVAQANKPRGDGAQANQVPSITSSNSTTPGYHPANPYSHFSWLATNDGGATGDVGLFPAAGRLETSDRPAIDKTRVGANDADALFKN